jgi:hypothetical protein
LKRREASIGSKIGEAMQVNPLFVPTLVGSAALFWLGLALQKKFHARRGGPFLWASAVVLACPGLLFVLYYAHMFDDAAWFYNLRAVPYTELLACGLGLAAGVLQSWWEPETFGEKMVAPGLIFLLVLVPFVKPLLDPLDISKLKDRYAGEVCLQSTFSTCGPASAATLLRSFGKIASEKELAHDSFTSRGGTEIWYLARALGKRGVRTSVVIRPGASAAIPSPAIAGVVLPGNAGHFIAILNTDRQRITIADPLKGKLVVASADLAHYYRFTGLFLVLRIPKPR